MTRAIVLSFLLLACNEAPAPSAQDGPPPMQPASGTLEGTVRERLTAGSYTYLRVERGETSHWVVTMGDGEPVGTRVRVSSFGEREEFHSPRLGRTFDRLRFGIVRSVNL